MMRFAERVLGLNARELARALPIFAYLFCTMAGSVASKAARDALFLDRFRPIDLPYVDIAIALLVGIVAGVYIRAGERTNVRNVQVGSLLAFAATALLFWWLTRAGASAVLVVIIYIWVGVLSVLIPTQVWTLANYVLTTREAKRSFGFIGGGAILGWIVGGLATRQLVEWYGTESTLLWVAAMMFLSTWLVWIVWEKRPSYFSGDSATGAREGGLWTSLSLVIGSRYLTSIALVIWFAAVVTSIAGWQFKAIAKENIPDTDSLTIFFGNFNIIAGLASFALQILLTSRVLRSAGVGLALFIVPIALTFSSIFVLIAASLAAVVTLKASDQVLRYSIDKATVELLYLPVPPGQTFRVKSFIDTAVYRFGDAIGGVAILVFAGMAGVSAVQMASITLVMLIGWYAAAMMARRQYVETLRDSIHQHRMDAERASAPVLDRTATELIASRLTGEPSEILYALSLFSLSHEKAIHPAVRALLGHESADVRRHAVVLLARAGDLSVLPDIERLLYDPHLEVRTEALLYLTQHAHVDPLERIEQLGDFPDFSIRGAMAAFLARPGPAQKIEAARAILIPMVCEAGAEGARARLEAARLLGILPDVFERELAILLQDPDPAVAAAAIRSIGMLRSRGLARSVVNRLPEPLLTEEAVATLATFGDGLVGMLRDCLIDPTIAIDVRREIPVVLLAIGTSAAQFVLLEVVLDPDTALRHRVITALNKLGQLYPDRRIDHRIIETVLAAEVMGHYRSYQVLSTLGALNDPDDPVAQGLRDSIQQEGERIFRLLKILFPKHDMHSVSEALVSTDPVAHDNALEFLDSVLTPQLRALLLPLFDRDVTDAERGRIATRLLGASLDSREEAMAVMMLSRDPWLQSCAAYAIGEFGLTKFAPTLDQWSADPDPLLRTTALDAKRKLQARSSDLPTASTSAPATHF